MNRDSLRDAIIELVKGGGMITTIADTILRLPSGLMLTRECDNCGPGGLIGVPDTTNSQVVHRTIICHACKGTGKQERRMTLVEMVEYISQLEGALDGYGIYKDFTAHDVPGEVSND